MVPIFLLKPLLLLLLPLQVHAVDIVLQWWSEGFDYFPIEARWDNVPPGRCLKPHAEIVPSLHNLRAGGTTFYHLRQNQFGAGWGATGTSLNDIINCSGVPILRVFGPSGAGSLHDSIDLYNPPWGDEDIVGTPQNVVWAATWIDLRLRFPPDSHGTRYLQWQGVRGAVWGTGTWSAASDGIPFPKMKRNTRETQRLNGEALRGTAYVEAPARWAYPDAYIINSSEYRSNDNGSYIGKDGSVLDLERLVSR